MREKQQKYHLKMSLIFIFVSMLSACGGSSSGTSSGDVNEEVKPGEWGEMVWSKDTWQ